MPWPSEMAPGVERRRSPTTGMTGLWTAWRRRETCIWRAILHAGGQDFLPRAGEQLDQLVAVEAPEMAGVDVHDGVHELALGGDHLVDLLLERPARDELEDLHAAPLAPAVHAVGRLVLARGVPPAVVVDDHARRREVDADAPGHEAAHEDPAVLLRVEAAD